MRCRKRRDVTETRLQSLAWDPAEARPAYGLGGDRHKGGVISVRALAGNGVHTQKGVPIAARVAIVGRKPRCTARKDQPCVFDSIPSKGPRSPPPTRRSSTS